MAGAVHRLEREDALILGLVAGDRDLEHVVAIPAPMAGSLPQTVIEHLRRIHLLVVPLEAAAHVADEVLEHLPALGMPEDDARTFFLEVEQVHLAAKATMIALLSFFQHMQILVQLLLRRPGRAIDAREHRVVGVAAPVSARDLHQLESVADLAGRGHVRTAAKIEPVALVVDLQILTLGDRIDQLELVALALVGKHLLGTSTIPDFPGKRPVSQDNFPHFLLDYGEIVRCEGLFPGEIVIKSVLDHRSDRDLRVRPKLLNGFREHMRGVVTDQFQCARIIARQDLDLAGCAERFAEIANSAINGISHGLLGERLRDRLGQSRAGCCGVVVAHGAVGECEGNLGHAVLHYPVPHTNAGGHAPCQGAARM